MAGLILSRRWPGVFEKTLNISSQSRLTRVKASLSFPSEGPSQARREVGGVLTYLDGQVLLPPPICQRREPTDDLIKPRTIRVLEY